jgi:uncharacterized protein (TIGR00296 family)
LSEKARTEGMFDSSDGLLLIRAVRESIRTFLESRTIVIPSALSSDVRFEQKRGCFVTLKNADVGNTLRGCIGFPEPVYKLAKALSEAAVYAATEDPRFPPIELSELDSLLIEVSVLTKPVRIDVEEQSELPEKIEVGKDGLVMKWSQGSGLLLPQVATEYHRNAEEFLENLGLKSGSHSKQWLVPGTSVYKFQAQVFQELAPNGKVVPATD